MTAPPLRRRMPSKDASFLYFEKPNVPLHIGSTSILDGHITRDQMIAHMESRMHRIPRYREIAVFDPLNLAHPRVLQLVMDMAGAGQALCVPGNHDVRLARKLRGHAVHLTHGLSQTLEQLAAEPPAHKRREVVRRIAPRLVDVFAEIDRRADQ